MTTTSFSPTSLSPQRALLGVAVASVSAAAVGAAMTTVAPLGAAYPLKAAAVPALLALVAPLASAHPWPVLGPANVLTLGRAVLVGLLAANVGEGAASGWVCGVVGCVAFGLDWADGRVARRTGFASPFGARLDMELDALTVLALSALVWQVAGVGPWVLLSGAMRYVFVAASWIWPWLDRPLPPDPRRAWVCGVQIALLLAALPASPGLATAMSAVGLAALTYSFAVDVRWLARHR